MTNEEGQLRIMAKKKGFDSIDEMLADRKAHGYYNFGLDEADEECCQCGTQKCSPCPYCGKRVY